MKNVRAKTHLLNLGRKRHRTESSNSDARFEPRIENVSPEPELTVMVEREGIDVPDSRASRPGCPGSSVPGTAPQNSLDVPNGHSTSIEDLQSFDPEKYLKKENSWNFVKRRRKKKKNKKNDS